MLNMKADRAIWRFGAKPLVSTMSGRVAVALLNRSVEEKQIEVNMQAIGIDADKGYTVRDIWAKKDYASSTKGRISMPVPAHGVVVLKISGTMKPFNMFQYNRK